MKIVFGGVNGRVYRKSPTRGKRFCVCVRERVWVRQGAPGLANCGLSGGEALALPDASDAVRVENLVHADDRHLLDKALRNNQAVKGIFVVKWKFSGENVTVVGHIKK